MRTGSARPGCPRRTEKRSAQRRSWPGAGPVVGDRAADGGRGRRCATSATSDATSAAAASAASAIFTLLLTCDVRGARLLDDRVLHVDAGRGALHVRSILRRQADGG